MPTFTVFTPPVSPQVEAGGEVCVAFTVTNRTDGEVYARLEVFPDKAPYTPWMRLEGKPERCFKAKESQTVDVLVCPPVDAPAGNITFHLDAMRLPNTDEDFAEGPTVAVNVLPAGTKIVPPPPPLPWWVIAAGAAAAALVIAVAAWLLWPAPSDPLKADWAAAVQTGEAPLEVAFLDQSAGNPTAWSWEFGDGQTSDIANPTHRFNAPGSYTVALTVTGKKGKTDKTSRNEFIKVTKAPDAPPAPAADFGVDTQSISRTGRVKFSDASTGQITNRVWDFGDGTPVSPVPNPEHVYNTAGTFTVRLTVRGPGGENVAEKKDLIAVAKLTQTKTIDRFFIPVRHPSLTKGDREFDGKGPDLSVSVALRLGPQNRSLVAHLEMTAQEVNGASRAEGKWDETIFSVPAGWHLNRILTNPLSVSRNYRDHSQHASETFAINWCNFIVWGDRIGPDIGDHPGDCGVSVGLSNLSVELIED